MKILVLVLGLVLGAGCSSCPVTEDDVAALEAAIAQQRRATVPHPSYDAAGVAAVTEHWDAIAELASAIRVAHHR